MHIYNHSLVGVSRALRRDATRHERKLWYRFLAEYPIRISRQRVIGNYIVDFYCEKAKLAIELDGSQHFTDSGLVGDKNRTDELNKFGVEVIRFSNSDIDNNFEGVCGFIDLTIKQRIKQ